MCNVPLRLRLYWDASAETTVRVTLPVAEGPSARTPPAEAFASYVQVSPVCQVGASKELGLGPVPASVPPLRFALARFLSGDGRTGKAPKDEPPTIHATIAARVVRCNPILRV